MSNEEKILELLQGMTVRMDKLEAGQADMTARMDRLEAGQARIQGDLTLLKGDVSGLKEDVSVLKEDHEITRGALNHLLDWTDSVSNAISFPLPKA